LPLSFGNHGIFVYTLPETDGSFSQWCFRWRTQKARRGLREEEVPPGNAKLIAYPTGIGGKTCAYLYPPRRGYVFEVGARTLNAPPELSVADEKQRVLEVRRMTPTLDVEAIDNVPARPPLVRWRSPQM
jgi:hypothetical protein